MLFTHVSNNCYISQCLNNYYQVYNKVLFVIWI